MFGTFIQKLFRKPSAKVDLKSESRHIATPLQPDITTLFPVIVPLELLLPAWPGPIVQLGDLPFAVTWAFVQKSHYFTYLNRTIQAAWEDSGVDWRQQAMLNLTEMAQAYPSAREKCDDEGKPFVQALLTDDAIGPSRLLVPHLYERVFGNDYRVAIPERTCAIVYRTSLTDDERWAVDGTINGCYERGTEPMSPERFEPGRFWVLSA